MTRGEALLAMEGGARVRQVWPAGSDEIVHEFSWFSWDNPDNDGFLECEQLNATEDPSSQFTLCPLYELVPEPDTAEKFVRDLVALFEKIIIDIDEKESVIIFTRLSEVLQLGEEKDWLERARALIQQMDGEK